MRYFILSLGVFMLGFLPVNFVSASPVSTAADAFFCTDCWAYADTWENYYYPDSYNHSYWVDTYEYCNDNFGDCASSGPSLELDQSLIKK